MIRAASFIASLIIFAAGASSVLADQPSSPPGNDGDLCHGANQESCRPDPQPSHGQDCLDHGNNTDGNDDHCSSQEATPSVTPSGSASPSSTPSETPSTSASPATPSPTPRTTPTTEASQQPTPSATPKATPTESPEQSLIPPAVRSVSSVSVPNTAVSK
jgi:hypothetical protein